MSDLADTIKKTMLTGIGLALKTRDELDDLVKDIEKKFDMSEKDGKKFLKDLQKKYDENQRKLEEKAEKAVKEFLKKADIVTADDLKGLKKEIRDLKKAISGEMDK